MAKLSFNASKVKEQELLPVGKYIASIIKSEAKQTKKKDGMRLNLSFKVLYGEEKGSVVFVGLNTENPSSQAVAISDRELKSICEAVGKGDDEIEDSEELHGIPMEITVKHIPKSDDYPAKAEISEYANVDDSEIYKDFVGESPVTKKVPWKKDKKGDEKEEK